MKTKRAVLRRDVQRMRLEPQLNLKSFDDQAEISKKNPGPGWPALLQGERERDGGARAQWPAPRPSCYSAVAAGAGS